MKFAFLIIIIFGQAAFAEGEHGIDSCSLSAAGLKYAGQRQICVEEMNCMEWFSGVFLRHYQAREVAGCLPSGDGKCPDALVCLEDPSVTMEELKHVTDTPSAPCATDNSGQNGAAR